MPELPEVEVVRLGLARQVVGSVVSAVAVLHDRPVRRFEAGPRAFEAELTGRRIEGARRRGKYLWLPLDDGNALLVHLGMSGQMLVREAQHPDERHLRVRVSMPEKELRFVDQRMFGGLLLSHGGAELPREIVHIARDPLDPEFDSDEFVSRVRRSRSGIKRQLLDQTKVSGVGNIYADESLWRARLHGQLPGEQISATALLQLLDCVREVMSEALGQGGTSFDALYVNVNGQSGQFDRSLRAYGRAGQPCARCGSLIRRVAFMNRSSFFCPSCQPLP
jgi:formamidopyrimidine-DNA glycosylase